MWKSTKFIVTMLVVAVGLLANATVVQAALAPSTIKKMKGEASDVLEVKVTKVEKTGATSSGREDFVVTATVTNVDRSKSEVKVGDTIKFESYRNVGLLPVIGPLAPPKLSAGWTGTIYLKAPKGDGPYKLAVFGHSFVEKGE